MLFIYYELVPSLVRAVAHVPTERKSVLYECVCVCVCVCCHLQLRVRTTYQSPATRPMSATTAQ